MIPLEELRKLHTFSLDEFKAYIADKPKSITQDLLDDMRTLFYYLRKSTPDVIDYVVNTLNCKLIFRGNVDNRYYGYLIPCRKFPIAFKFRPEILRKIAASKDFQLNLSTFFQICAFTHIPDDVLCTMAIHVRFNILDGFTPVQFYTRLLYRLTTRRAMLIFDNIKGDTHYKFAAMLSRRKVNLPYYKILNRVKDIAVIALNTGQLSDLFVSCYFSKHRRMRLLLLFIKRLSVKQRTKFINNIYTIACDIVAKHTYYTYRRDNANTTISMLITLTNQKFYLRKVTSLSTFYIIKPNAIVDEMLIINSFMHMIDGLKQNNSLNRSNYHMHVKCLREIDYISTESKLPILTVDIMNKIESMIDMRIPYVYLIVVIVVHTALINNETPSHNTLIVMKKISSTMSKYNKDTIRSYQIFRRVIGVFRMFINLTNWYITGIPMNDINPYDYRQKTYERMLA